MRGLRRSLGLLGLKSRIQDTLRPRFEVAVTVRVSTLPSLPREKRTHAPCHSSTFMIEFRNHSYESLR
jgi:hypothetical protein